MNQDEAGRTGTRNMRRLRVIGLGVVATWLCVACSGGSDSTNRSTTAPTAIASSSTGTGATTSTSTSPTTPTTAAPSTTRAPSAHCPVLKPIAALQEPLKCTSSGLVAAAAAKVGLKRGKDDAILAPGVFLLDYTRIVLLPVGSIRTVYIFHHANNEVIYAICEGVVAKTLDPVLRVCTDVGAVTRTDRPEVRAWVLRAEAVIAKSPKALPVLTSGNMMYVACQNQMFPKSSDPENAFEVNLIVQPAGEPADGRYCKDA